MWVWILLGLILLCFKISQVVNKSLKSTIQPKAIQLSLLCRLGHRGTRDFLDSDLGLARIWEGTGLHVACLWFHGGRNRANKRECRPLVPPLHCGAEHSRKTSYWSTVALPVGHIHFLGFLWWVLWPISKKEAGLWLNPRQTFSCFQTN